MWRRVRTIAVVIAIGLGLISQVMGVPAIASSAAKSECPLAHGKCPGSGMAGHIGMQPCQPPCLAPATLPGANAMAAPAAWTEHRFALSAGGIPAGLNPAPDPLPPRPRLLA